MVWYKVFFSKVTGLQKVSLVSFLLFCLIDPVFTYYSIYLLGWRELNPYFIPYVADPWVFFTVMVGMKIFCLLGFYYLLLATNLFSGNRLESHWHLVGNLFSLIMGAIFPTWVLLMLILNL